VYVGGRQRRWRDTRAVTNDVLLDELGRKGIERAIGDAVEGHEDGWRYYLGAELSENEDGPDRAADELGDESLVEAGVAVGSRTGARQLLRPDPRIRGYRLPEPRTSSALGVAGTRQGGEAHARHRLGAMTVLEGGQGGVRIDRVPGERSGAPRSSRSERKATGVGLPTSYLELPAFDQL